MQAREKNREFTACDKCFGEMYGKERRGQSEANTPPEVQKSRTHEKAQAERDSL